MPKVKRTKKSASKKATAAKAAPPAPAVEQAAPVENAVVAAPPAETVPSLSDSFQELLGQLAVLRSQLTSVTGQVRALQKRSERELKNAQKAGRKRARKTGNRAPSGEVTREINTYIRAHKLQDPKNGRRILADSKLRTLLKLKKDDELTYFNLQRYMSPHFAKSAKAKAKAGASN